MKHLYKMVSAFTAENLKYSVDILFHPKDLP